METIGRRHFLKTTAALSGLTTLSGFMPGKAKPKLSFSTLGCPDWSWEQINHFASVNGYAGIEIRGVQRELNLPQSRLFRSREAISSSLSVLKEKKLSIVNLGSSTNLHVAEASERKKQLDEARSFIDLAVQLNCPYIRVFPNNLLKDRDKKETLDLIASGLIELGDYAKSTPVTVLMETHGDLVCASDILEIMDTANHPQVGLVWDVVNMWVITREQPDAVYPKLKKYIRHIHIKDLVLVDGKIRYTLLGRGESPVLKAVDLLYADGYKGYYSFEWEKLWHPEIEEPDVAIADYARKMQDHFK